MKNVKFEKPVFKHTRKDLIEAMFGDLHEDAAIIAKEELKKADKVFLKAVKDLDDDTKFDDSYLCELAWANAINAQHLSMLLIKVGQLMQIKRDPINRLIGVMTGGQCDCPACKERRNEES